MGRLWTKENDEEAGSNPPEREKRKRELRGWDVLISSFWKHGPSLSSYPSWKRRTSP
jgi:hypothetical protein